MLSRWLATVAILAVGFVAGTQVTGRLQSLDPMTGAPHRRRRPPRRS